MLKRIYAWCDSWYETLKIKFFHPELYKHLTSPLNFDDFIEVGPPAFVEAIRVRDEVRDGIKDAGGFVGAGITGNLANGFRVKVLLESEDCPAALLTPSLIAGVFIDRYITGELSHLAPVTVLELIDAFLDDPSSGVRRSRPERP